MIKSTVMQLTWTVWMLGGYNFKSVGSFFRSYRYKTVFPEPGLTLSTQVKQIISLMYVSSSSTVAEVSNIYLVLYQIVLFLSGECTA